MTDLLRILIVDDEDLARSRLRSLLSRTADVEIVGEAAGGADAVSAIRASKPDLVLLDVQMPGLDGFDVIAEIGPEEMPPVVFITAFDEHAVSAFEVGAMDYLLKPVDADRFTQAIARARGRMQRTDSGDDSKRLVELLRQVRRDAGVPERLALKVQGKVLFLDPRDVYYIQAHDDLCRVHLAEGAYEVREPLSRLEARLAPGMFLRVHRSVLVNVGRINFIEPFDQGDQLIVLQNGKRISTGRSYRRAVQELMSRRT